MYAVKVNVGQTQNNPNYPEIDPKQDLKPQVEALIQQLSDEITYISDSIKILQRNSSTVEKTRSAFNDVYQANNRNPAVRANIKYVLEYNKMRHIQSQNSELDEQAKTLLGKFDQYIEIFKQIIQNKQNGFSDCFHNSTTMKENKEITEAKKGLEFLENNRAARTADITTIVRERTNEDRDLNNFFPSSGMIKSLIGLGTTSVIGTVEVASAIKIQRIFRDVFTDPSRKSKLKNKKICRELRRLFERNAILKIQSKVRQCLAKTTYNSLKEKKEQEDLLNLKNTAIVKIQRFLRERNRRKKYLQSGECKLLLMYKQLHIEKVVRDDALQKLQVEKDDALHRLQVEKDEELKKVKQRNERLKAKLAATHKEANELRNLNASNGQNKMVR
ncbi:MAG: hypothetical protein S4CHLAM20_08640 [Chlamydiia bacterium]|nr:hypothetical protein [Chlamydiia bacterium]